MDAWMTTLIWSGYVLYASHQGQCCWGGRFEIVACSSHHGAHPDLRSPAYKSSAPLVQVSDELKKALLAFILLQRSVQKASFEMVHPADIYVTLLHDMLKLHIEIHTIAFVGKICKSTWCCLSRPWDTVPSDLSRPPGSITGKWMYQEIMTILL